jgi:NAD(P)H-dependent FMN reductase
VADGEGGGSNVKRFTAIVGTARKRSTHKAVLQFLKNLQSHGDVEYEIVALCDYRLDMCRAASCASSEARSTVL